jgi:hypothetical protein
MNHAKPIDPDEMYGTNETKKLKRRKGKGEDDGRHAWLPTAKRISVRLWLDSPGTHSSIYPASFRLENTSKLTAPYSLSSAVDS